LDAHLKASGIILVLGIACLLVAGVVLSVPIVLIGRRREAQHLIKLHQRNREA
jgi:hypothetical protein